MVKMIVVVTMEVIVVATVGLHIYFRVVGWGKERGFYS